MSKGYEGKIKNSGSQHVQAPNASRGSVKGNVRITGNDLRTGKKSGKYDPAIKAQATRKNPIRRQRAKIQRRDKYELRSNTGGIRRSIWH